ncbi:hypothetical protein UPYG_G00294350 [Umbra pygmaea]|uniref:DRBM domain-containing protein n=1 Tax=Umbra pygmaea TaxID=75934 RepID=A0ABD0W5S9_UMBPY
MDSFRRFQDDGYKNWIKTTMGLNCLKSRLGEFLENETKKYHEEIRNKVKPLSKGALCKTNCDPKVNSRSNQVPKVCKEVCEQWRDAILSYHKGGPVYWHNSKPYLWPTKQWEVAKVHMSFGNREHTTVDEFDISAFLSLMSSCIYFRKFVEPNLITKVTIVRNKVMHSADFRVKRMDLETYLRQMKALGHALENDCPDLRELAEEIDQIQNKDFGFMVNRVESDSPAASTEDIRKMEQFLSQEQQILKEKLECLSQRYEKDQETALTPEERQCVWMFLEGNKDLQETLAPQWERLTEVQKRVDMLTNRVDSLERNIHAPDSEFNSEVFRYKNHLYEEAQRRGWPEPVFSEIKEASGYRGRVMVRGLAFEGTQVYRGRKTAHQEVAKLALSKLPANLSELANDTEEGGASSNQSDQPTNISCTGPTFFGSVTVVLNTNIPSGDSHSEETEAVESAYRKLAVLLNLPQSDSFSKAAVLKHCETRDVQPPLEAVTVNEEGRSYHCTLRFTGPITFYVLEGCSKKKQAQQQAAKVAFQRLSGVLSSKKVLGENYVSALKELLEAQTPQLDPPIYKVTDRGGEEGEGKEKEVQSEEGEACPPIPSATMMPIVNPAERQEILVTPMDSSVTTAPMDPTVTMDTMAMDTTVVENNTIARKTHEGGASVADTRQATPTLPEERSGSSDIKQFFACVTVRIQKDRVPCEASTQEGALQAAYCSLLQALSLDPPNRAGGEQQCVLEFFRQKQSAPPKEECVTTMDGKHSCTLGIVGELTFNSPEAAPKKQQAEQWAAREALKHLSGFLSGVMGGDTTGSNPNYKGRLQELLAKYGGGAKPEYTTPEANRINPGPAAGQVTGDMPGSTQQSDKLSVSIVVDMATRPEDSGPPPPKRAAGGEMEEIRRCLSLCGMHPPRVVCESVYVEQLCEWGVEVQLERYIFQNDTRFSSKKEAIRVSYHILGTAGEICQSAADPVQSTAKVKTFFTQRGFHLPLEDVKESETGRFCCNLRDITCVFSYCGQGSSEDAARQSAYEKAFAQLAPFIGHSVSVAPPSSAEEAEQRLRTLLEKASGLKPARSALKGTQFRSSAQLRFSGYSMEIQCAGNKKNIRAKLCQTLLGLLGEEHKGTSVRNILDEWFVKRELKKPVFEDNPSGTKVTFSTPLLCSYTDWQDSVEKAEKRLVDELQRRMKCMCDLSTN